MRHILVFYLCLVAPSLFAQQHTHPCARQIEPAARLACYDKAFPQPTEVIEAAKETARAEFGLKAASERAGGQAQLNEQFIPERIENRVVKVDRGREGQGIFTLENGQVWMQVETRSSGHLQPGDVVQLRKGTFGGYHLVMPNGVIRRVRRTR